MNASNRNDGWILGRIYFNTEDKRVIVKRLHGGYTMNFGNKMAWILNIIFVIGISIMVVAVL